MQLTLPMGFSWATYIAQSVTSKKFEECIPPIISQPLSDVSESKVLVCKPGHSCHFTYIDNLGMISASQQYVQKTLDKTVAKINADHMPLHEIDIQEGLCQTLGVILDTENFQTMNTWKRFGLIKNSISAVLGKRVVFGWTLEVLLGHCTYFALVRRDLLPVSMLVMLSSVSVICRRSLCGKRYAKS